MNDNFGRPGLRLVTLIAVVLLTAGCASGAASSPLPAATPGPTGETTIRTANEAAGHVLTQLGRWPGIGPFDPNAIGQCCGYRVSRVADGWTVTIEVGWGDCPAGCINRHQWRYLVRPDATVVAQGESGPVVPAGVPGAEASGGSSVP